MRRTGGRPRSGVDGLHLEAGGVDYTVIDAEHRAVGAEGDDDDLDRGSELPGGFLGNVLASQHERLAASPKDPMVSARTDGSGLLDEANRNMKRGASATSTLPREQQRAPQPAYRL